MGKRGPAKTPQALNDLRGNPGRRPARKGAQFPSGDMRCPDWLGDHGRAKWDEMVPLLSAVDGLLKPAFGDLLGLYCEAFEEMLAAKGEIDKEGATCSSDKGGMYQHPAVGRKNKAIQRMRLFGQLFGLSPSDEGNLKLVGGGDDGETDPLILLMNEAS